MRAVCKSPPRRPATPPRFRQKGGPVFQAPCMGASVLPDEAIRGLVTPVGNAAGILDFQLRDANGREILHGGAERSGADITAPLSYLYSMLPPGSWLLPQPVAANRSFGNLYWSATVAPRVALGLRAAEIEQHGRIIAGFLGGFAGLAVLLWLV